MKKRATHAKSECVSRAGDIKSTLCWHTPPPHRRHYGWLFVVWLSGGSVHLNET